MNLPCLSILVAEYFEVPFVVKMSLTFFLFVYCRDQLKRHYNLGQYYLEVDLQDLTSYDEQLADKLTKNPAEFLPLVSFSYDFDLNKKVNLMKGMTIKY